MQHSSDGCISFFKTIIVFVESKLFWWSILGLLTSMLGIAFYWQYVLNELPCQACIHARLWVFIMAFIAALLACLPPSRGVYKTGRLLIVGCCIGLGERAYFLYEIENFRGDGSCGFTLGMPTWLAVDTWFPALFEVQSPCSFTPEIIPGVSMAESLLLLCFLVAISCALPTLARLK